jgi:hypothetical protein
VAYAVVADIRALDGLSDIVVHPDATLQSGIDFATDLIDDYCGTSFEAKAFTVTKDGTGRVDLYIGVLFVATLTSVLIDGVSVPVGNFKARPEGVLVRTDGVFTPSLYGLNVIVSGTAGVTSTPAEDIKWACRTVARQYALELHSRIPSRALQVSNELGQFEMRAQAGGPGRPTSLPDVNVVLNRNKHKAGNMGQGVFT